MSKKLFAAVLAVALLAAPLPALMHSARAQTAQTETAKPGKKAKKAKKAKKPPTPGQLAARARQKKCGAEWRAAKKAGKIEKGMTWPKYWSACNKRLKAAGG
jgi:Ni/Co efflux regulator RcnB